MASRLNPGLSDAADAHSGLQPFDPTQAQLTLDSIGDAVLCVDAAGVVTYLNAVAADMTGWSTMEAPGRPLTDVLRIIDATSREPAMNPLVTAMLEDKCIGLSPDSMLLHRDGREFAIEDTAAPIRDAAGRVIGAVIVFHDVSVARERAARMSRLAYHDPLTGLPNRALLDDRISQAIGSARRHGKLLAVLYIDVDRFKSLNDTLGHPVGDELLQSIGRRLDGCVRRSDTVSRIGGDEFVVLLTDLDCPADAATTASKMLVAVSARARIAEHHLSTSISVGIALYPADGRDATTLLKCADMALLRAKAGGRGRYEFFDSDMARAGRACVLESAAPRSSAAWPPVNMPARRAAGVPRRSG